MSLSVIRKCVLVLISLSLVIISESLIHKCCPEYHELTKTDSFECVPETNGSFSFPFVGYQIGFGTEPRIPECVGNGTSLVLQNITYDGIEVPAGDESCVDLLNGYYKHLSCDNGSVASLNATEKIPLVNFWKCCDAGESYNLFSRECVPDEDSDASFFSTVMNFNFSAVIDSGVPECKDVLVEYHSADHPIAIEYTKNQITFRDITSRDVYSADKFCLEKVTNKSTRADFKLSDYKPNSSKWMARVCRSNDICDKIPCVRKCCDTGKILGSDYSCGFNQLDIQPRFHKLEGGDFVGVETPEFGVLHNLECDMYMLSPTDNYLDEYHINAVTGHLHLNSKKKDVVENDNYCIENFLLENSTIELRTFICFLKDSSDSYRHTAYGILLLISSCFLILTLIILLLVPNVNNIHGDALIFHVFSMLVASVTMAGMKLIIITKCVIVSYLAYFGFLAAFAWLNVMCFDIYWSFGVRGLSRMPRLLKDRYYFFYGFGTPTIFIFMAYLTDLMSNGSFAPHIGTEHCWFSNFGGPGHIIFFILPVAIQLSINLVLFGLTCINYFKAQKEIVAEGRTVNKLKLSDLQMRFTMISKLFVVMGISWLFEIIGTFSQEPKWFWWIPDCFNMLQGVLVFFIFVAKKDVYDAVMSRLGYQTNNEEIIIGLELLEHDIRHERLIEK